MPLVPAKCTNCGASLEIDNTNDALVCPYCNFAFIVEKAINNYNVSNNNNIHADVVNIYGENSADFIIRAGTLEKYCGASTDVVIPNTVKNIGEGAFENCKALASIVLPDSVKIIDKNAFSGCVSLKSIIIPNSVMEIGVFGFRKCTGLTHVTIPDSVEKIGDFAFAECKALISVEIPNSVTKVEGSVFSECSALMHVTIPNSVTSIGDLAFCQCSSLTDITIPNSVVSIGDGAFFGCTNLTSIEVPYGVNIGTSAFYNCPGWKKSGCYVATAIYGSYDCPEVWTLRRYRDYTLAKTWYGRTFISCYYAFSPTAVKWFGKTKWFNHLWKGKLDWFVAKLQDCGVDSSPYKDRHF